MSDQAELDKTFKEVLSSNPEYWDRIKKLDKPSQEEALRRSKLIVEGLDKIDNTVVGYLQAYPEITTAFLVMVMEYALGTFYLRTGRNVNGLRVFTHKIVQQIIDSYPPENEGEKR